MIFKNSLNEKASKFRGFFTIKINCYLNMSFISAKISPLDLALSSPSI